MKSLILFSALIFTATITAQVQAHAQAQAQAQPQPGFVPVPEEFIFRQDSANTFTAETASADLGLTSQSGAFFGSLQITARNRIRLNLSGQYFDLPARIERTTTSQGTFVLSLYVPATAFAHTNSENKRRGAFECVAMSADHLRCSQTLYVKSGEFSF